MVTLAKRFYIMEPRKLLIGLRCVDPDTTFTMFMELVEYITKLYPEVHMDQNVNTDAENSIYDLRIAVKFESGLNELKSTIRLIQCWLKRKVSDPVLVLDGTYWEEGNISLPFIVKF